MTRRRAFCLILCMSMLLPAMVGCIGGLIAGLLIAALFSRMLISIGPVGVILAAISPGELH